MCILKYDEAATLQNLGGMSLKARVVFAVLCALRICPAYRRFHERTGRGDPDIFEATVDQLWDDLLAAEMSNAELHGAVHTVTGLIPTEDEGWDEESQPYAEDAAAALAYALRARLSGSAQEAAWASRRVYEAIDHFVAASLGVSLDGPEDEIVIISNPLIQAELLRQQRDLRELAELEEGGITHQQLSNLRARSMRESAVFFRPPRQEET